MMKYFLANEIGSILKYFWAKILLTIPMGYFVFRQDHFLVIYALLLILILDTILGIWVSAKYKIFTSHRLARVTSKMARYAIGLASVWILACMSPSLFGWSFQFFGTFFVLTEVFSNFEKLSLLGLHIPTKVLAKLNSHFHSFYFGGEDAKREAVSKILSKGEANSICAEDIKLNKNIFNK